MYVYIYMYVCVRAYCGRGAAPSELPSRYLEVLLEEVPDALEHVPHLALTVGMGGKGVHPQKTNRPAPVFQNFPTNIDKIREKAKKTTRKRPTGNPTPPTRGRGVGERYKEYDGCYLWNYSRRLFWFFFTTGIVIFGLVIFLTFDTHYHRTK